MWSQPLWHHWNYLLGKKEKLFYEKNDIDKMEASTFFEKRDFLVGFEMGGGHKKWI